MQEESFRIRKPLEEEVLGKVIEFLGGDRVRLICDDGKERIGRIRGKIKKRMWMGVGSIVLLKPWVTEPDKKADIVFVYRKAEAKYLKKKGFLKILSP